MWNIVDSTVGQIPITKVNVDKDRKVDNHNGQPMGKIEQSVQSLYEPEQMEGLPVGIQVVGGMWEEEKVLGIMKIIESCWEDDVDRVRPGSFLNKEGLKEDSTQT